MPKESTIQHYTSSTTGSAPTSGNLASGELAINTADEKIFYKNHVGTVLSLSQTKDLSGAFAASSKVVSSFNGATGAVTFTVPLATTSLTGTASFNPSRFQVSATGNVDLLAAYQATGDTVITVAGSGIGIVTSGKTDTLYNIGVTSFNGLTGNVSLTGDGGSSLVLGNTVVTNRIATTAATGVASFNSTYFSVSNGAVSLAAAYQATGSGIATVPLATTSLTGTASFNPNRFQVSATGNVDLLAAYQATGDTIITVAGSGIGIATSGKTDTLYNIGVTSFNGLTGNVSMTGDGGSSLVLGNTVVTNRIATTAATGVASFNSTYFTVSNGAVSLAAAYQATGSGLQTVPLATTSVTGTASFNPSRFQVSATGNVDLLAAYQVTGQTVVSGGASQLISTSGNTVTIDNRVATTSVTGVASFNGTRFSVSAAGAVDLAAAYQATGDTIAAGSFINFSQSGTTKTLNNIGVQTFNGATGAVTFTVPLATTSLTGTASFNPSTFTVSATGNVNLLAAFQATGDTVVAGDRVSIATSGKTKTISAAVPIASASATGVASFDGLIFNVDGVGKVGLNAAYSTTGDTVITVAGSGIGIVTSGKTDTLYNIGVTSFNSLTGNISFTGDGGSSLVLGNTVVTNRIATTAATGVASFNSTYFTVSNGAVSLAAAYQATGGGIATVPLATTSLTGTASFNPNRFQVSATGNVDLLAAFQATGDTVITVAGSGIGIVTSGKTDTLYNIGVTSFNGFTGAVQVTGSGAILHTVSGTTTTFGARLSTTAVTGVASFSTNDFVVGTTGHVSLTGTVARTNTTNNFTAVQAFPNGISGAWLRVGTGATFGSVVDLTSTTAKIVGTNTAGYLRLESFGTLFSIQAQPAIILQDGDTDLGGNGTITINPSTGGGGGNVVIGNASSPSITLDGNTINSGRMTVIGGLSAQALTVVAGATFGARSSFTSGLTTQSLYVSQGATFNSTAAFAGNISAPNIVNSVNGQTGNIAIGLASSSLTGLASFNTPHFSVSATGHVSLGSAYQATGDTIIAGTNITISRAGNAVTVNSSGGAASAAGSDTQVQYNASGSLSADNGLVYTVSTETLRIGSAVRHLEISPGIDNNIQAFGSSNLRLTQQAGNPITIGDFDGSYGGNNTYISVDDTLSLIAMYAATVTLDSTVEVGFDARVLGGLSANSLFVSTGATFAGNISAKNIVNSVNGLTGAITLTSGSNITLTPSGNTITIASSGISRSISTITTSTSAGASASYDYVFIGATSGNINLTLPTAVSNTNRYSVKQTNAVGTLTLLTTSSQTIDGLTAFALNKQYQAVDLISDNANWHIL
jgi:hypothetical protein